MERCRLDATQLDKKSSGAVRLAPAAGGVSLSAIVGPTRDMPSVPTSSSSDAHAGFSRRESATTKGAAQEAANNAANRAARGKPPFVPAWKRARVGGCFSLLGQNADW